MTRPMHAWMIALALTGWASSARAQSVRLVDTPCASVVPERALAGSLEIELFGDGVAGVGNVSEADALAVVELSSSCAEPLVVSVRTSDRLTDASLSRDVVLADVPPSLRVRTLALAVAELLRATWYVPTTFPDPPALVSPTRELGLPRDANLRRTPRPAERSERLGGEVVIEESDELPLLLRADVEPPWRPLAAGIEGVGRLFPQTGLGLLGGRAVFAAAATRGSGLVIDAGILSGPVLSDDRHPDVLLLPFGVSWTAQLTAGDGRAVLGPRLEGGPVHVRWGVQRQTGWGAYLVATMTGHLRGRLAEGAWASVSADLGWTLIGPEVDGLDASPLVGPTMSLSVALLAAP